MKRSMGLMLVALSLGFFGCSSGSSFVRADYDFKTVGKIGVVCESKVLKAEEKKEVADLFAAEVLKKGFAVVDRANLDQMMQETEFQNESGVTSDAAKAKLAVANIQAMVIVNVSQFTDDVAMTAKMVKVGDGDLLWMGEGTGSLNSGMATITGALIGAGAGAGAGQAVGKNTEGTVIGGVAGAAGGALIGHALEPKKAELTRKVIAKTCKDMPSLLQAK